MPAFSLEFRDPLGGFYGKSNEAVAKRCYFEDKQI